MFKRVTIVALVVAAFVLVMAVPALAFNGYRCGLHDQRLLLDLPQGGSAWLGAPKVVRRNGQ